jgi:Putative quorum-sensing-regulated virulence factor
VSTSALAMPFGRHKGVPLTELDNGYLHWLYTKLDEWHPPLREAVLAERARRKGLPTAESPQRQLSSTATRHPAASAPELVCNICGLRGSADRPLVHARCATDEVPF